MRLTSQRQRSNYLRDFLKDRATLRSEANPRGLRDSKQSVMQYSLDATNGRCAYCGVKISHRNTNTGKWEKTGNDGDHLYPASKGAPFIEGQIVYSCKECNAKKNDLDPIEFLSYLHAINPPEKLFIEDLDEHVEFFMDRFIGHFIHNVPDQILVMMGSDSGVSDDDIDLIEAMDRDPSLMTFTPDVQSAFIARSLGHKKEVNRAHKELFMFSFNAYDEELKKLAKSKGKSYRDQFYSSYTVFDWFSCIPGELGLDPNDVLNMDKIIEDHRDDTDSEMRIAGSVQDFMRPVMLSLRQRVTEAREDYEEKLQAWRDSGEVGSEPTDQSTTVYNRHCRSWNLLMKSFLTSDVVQGDPSKAELIRNSILPPTQAGLNQLLDLPSYVDPLQKLRFTASMILDDKKDMAYLKMDAGDDGETNILDLSWLLPKNLPLIKGMYESRREQQSTPSNAKKKAKYYNLLSWGIGSFKDDLFIRILLSGNDLVDGDGNLNTRTFTIALIEKLREEVLTRNDDGMLKLPDHKSPNYSAVSTLFNSLNALASIVLGWEVPRQIRESTMTKLIQDEDALARFIEERNSAQSELLDLEVQSMDDVAYENFLNNGNYNNLSMSQIVAGVMRMKREREEMKAEFDAEMKSLQEAINETSEELDKKDKELREKTLELEIVMAKLDVLCELIENGAIKSLDQIGNGLRGMFFSNQPMNETSPTIEN